MESFKNSTVYWALSSTISEDVVGESTCRSTRTQKHSTNTGVSWAATLRTGLHMNRSANETNQNDYLQNGCGGFGFFFPPHGCLIDIEPLHFCQDRTKDCTLTVLSGIWFGYRMCNCFKYLPTALCHPSLRQNYINQKLYKGNKCRVPSLSQALLKNIIEKKISRALQYTE